ncbi:hypothetical protein PLICRDRAFT_105186 [Plicaturopsis crispa FD-325 SS-3]|nr:hypothetical protein PLICRDRAFT_105186 [Plicaturopsis crispa FD-325 SS-3]
MTSSEQRNIVIIGGGIIGCTTAYYLSRHPSFSSSTSVTVLEASAHGIAQGASGKAGGLVAKWAYPRPLVDVSFREHVRLAEEHDGAERWGWRFVNCGSWEGKGEVVHEAGTGVGKGGQRKSLEKMEGLPGGRSERSRTDTGMPDDLRWIKEGLTDSYSPMAPPGATAQVHPYLFTNGMLDLAKEKGVQLVSGRATSIDIVDGQVTGVTYSTSADETATLPATDVILAAGAWSPNLIPELPIEATRAHSIVIRPPPSSTIAPYVLFTEITLPSSRPKVVSPEIYARPDNTVYACGPGDSSALPPIVDEVEVDQEACESIRTQVASISTELRVGTVEKRQACFLPVVSTGGGPIVGAVRGVKGLMIATGHTCWGICNAPGTAKAISELVMDGKIRCADLTSLAPGRFMKISRA